MCRPMCRIARAGGTPFLALMVSLAGLLPLAGCGGSTDAAVEPAGQNDKSADTSAGKSDTKPRVLVRLGEFRRGDISTKLPVPADLEAVEEAEVYPEIAGVIREVRSREGSFVRRGQEIVVLVDDELRLIEENKRILLEQARTKLSQAKLASREGKAALEQKTLLLEQAEAEYDRALSSKNEGILSPEEAESKRYEREQVRLDKTAATLALEKYGLAEKEAEQSQRLADVELKTATHNLSRTRICSPIEGYISYLELKSGETVTQATRVFSVVNLERLEARVHVPQRALRQLKVEQPVRITCDVYPDREFWGEVEVINPVIDDVSGTVRLIVGVRDPSQLLKPGMFINGEIVLDTHKNAWLIPKKAVVYENQEPIVFLIHGETARRYVMTAGYSTKNEIEVIALTDGKGKAVDPSAGRLVLVGQNNLKDGSLVEIERKTALREPDS